MIDWTSQLQTWFSTQWYEPLFIALCTIGVYGAVIAYTRLFGLRSFSKMSSFDFAATIAIGSLLAATLTPRNPSLAHGAIALLCLYTCQWLVQRGRLRSGFSDLVDNTPVLLMVGDQMREQVMRDAGITKCDLYAKLREANVLHLGQVRAVVLEATGDISVLHGEADGVALDPDLLSGVDGADALRASSSSSSS